jgi:hypothetical protein
MRRVTVEYEDGDADVWKCRTASYGADSRSVILYGAAGPLGGEESPAKPLERVLLPLKNVRSVTESEW